MAKVIDLRDRITNALPLVTITDELTVTVNNRKSVVLDVMAMINESEQKKKKGKEVDDIALTEKALGMMIGEKSVEAINELDLPFPEYQLIFNTVLEAATGNDSNTPK